MPDDVVVPAETPEPVQAAEVPQETPEVTPAPVVVEDEPHPLDPGGKRFSEVYGEMKDARREAQELRERLARLEGEVQATKPADKPAERMYTPEEMQALVDAGRITPMKATQQIAWQQAELKAREERQQRQVEDRQRVALNEVNQYVDKLPGLRNSSSPEFAKVARIAQDIADDMGKPTSDPIVQRRACREAFGSLERLAKAATVRETTRQNADTHVETSGGGGSVTTTSTKDPLKDVPQHYKDHWKRLGYSQQQMIDEAQYLRPRRR